MRCSPRGCCSVAALFVLALGCTAVRANDIYIAQTATGANTGQNCANAYAYTFFNTSSNWGTGANQIGPGTTVHLCGTLTGAAGSSMLTAQGGGAAGSPVTILFESGATLTAPYWSVNGAISLGSNSYITVDGGVPCGPGGAVCNGTIVATNNGSALAYQNGSMGIVSYGGNLEIRNLGIYDMYVHTSPSDNGGSNAECLGLWGTGINSGILVHDNTMHDASWCIVYGYNGTASNVQIYNNNVYNSDHDVAIAGAAPAGSALTNVLIYNNHFHDFSNWDTTSNAWHHDGVHFYGSGNSSTESAMVYSNLFDGATGGNWTSGLFMEQNANIQKAYVFNNVFNVTPPVPGYGSLALSSPNSGAFVVANNTFMSGNWVYIVGCTGVTFENNASSGGGIWFNNSTVGVLNYNVYGSFVNGLLRWNNNYEATLARWQSDSGGDANAYATPGNVALGANFAPLLGSPVIHAGTNLATLGVAALDSDRAGVARPSVGAWDAGAYTYVSGSVAPLAPTGLTTITH